MSPPHPPPLCPQLVSSGHREGHRGGQLQVTVGPNTDDHGHHPPWPASHSCRFESLQEPLWERRAALEAWSLLLQFLRDADEEMAWVQEKLSLAAAQDYGQSLSAVWHLQKQHQVWACPGMGRVCPWTYERLKQPVVPGALCPRGALVHAGFFAGHKDRLLLRGKSVGAHEASGTPWGPARSAQQRPHPVFPNPTEPGE